jgi:hypothetical protein
VFVLTARTDQPQPAPEHSETPGEYAQFEDLAAKLIQVPKEELDEKRRKA